MYIINLHCTPFTYTILYAHFMWHTLLLITIVYHVSFLEYILYMYFKLKWMKIIKNITMCVLSCSICGICGRVSGFPFLQAWEFFLLNQNMFLSEAIKNVSNIVFFFYFKPSVYFFVMCTYEKRVTTALFVTIIGFYHDSLLNLQIKLWFWLTEA